MNEALEELRATLGREGCIAARVWGVGGTEVLCFRRWEEVRGRIDDRIRIFLALLDALGVTPVWK